MSAIVFHSPQGMATVHGAERALFGSYCNHAMLGALGIDRNAFSGVDWLTVIWGLLRRDGGPITGYPMEHLPCYLSVQQDATFCLGDGREASVFAVALNTLLASGSDPMVLAARIHGQCEIHAYVEGPNRAWLAGIIEQGRASAIYRAGMGWEGVIELLRSNGDEPVALSFSATEGFPNPGVAEAAGIWTAPEDDPDGDSWYGLAFEEQWNFGLAALRQTNGLELCPDEWRWPDYWIGGSDQKINAFHVCEVAYEMFRAGVGTGA